MSPGDPLKLKGMETIPVPIISYTNIGQRVVHIDQKRKYDALRIFEWNDLKSYVRRIMMNNEIIFILQHSSIFCIS